MYCLDTNVCLDWLKAREPALLDRARQVAVDRIRIPSMVQAELFFGAEICRHPTRERRELQLFLRHFTTLPFDDAAAMHYARIRAELTRRGALIGANDLVIAATALAAGDVLVTRNVAEFSRIDGLTLEDWTQP